MIRELSGTVLSVEPSSAVIDVGGWGVQVHLTAADTLAEGATVRFKTYLCISQNGVDLYGFRDEADRAFFELLLQVSGVGPKTALSILRRGTRETLTGAIGTRDLTYLTRVVGLGKKAAEKLIVELAEKVGPATAHDVDDAEVFDTLVALGYTEREARATLARVPLTITGKDERLKAALSMH